MIQELLQRWCDGMIRVQIDSPDTPSQHGALGCPACGKIHGRCMDAVYPFFHMAKASGDSKYLDAGKAVFEWSKNVSQPDGSWTVMPDPKSWKGITVFGAIALAETLHHHGDLLDKATLGRWTERLELAANYVFENFDLDFANINYGFTAIYALNLVGRHLDEPRYVARSRELAKGVKLYFTEPNSLIYGEAKPTDRRSANGYLPVDLGYNVEESLNGLALYALEENDTKLLKLIETSLASHLEFMLPDGGWDNSWGTRQFKWTYWGSRTSDGCQPAYTLMAHRNPAFATAAYRSTELLQRCTSSDGLLYGGIHYTEHGIDPCVHHTFAHAKPLAYLLDHGSELPKPNEELPRSTANGITGFPEIATLLAARGPWRATVTSYDFLYKPEVQQATGGALSLLWHEKTGPLCVASLATYLLVEPYNQQEDPDQEDFPLTPRLERVINGDWFTNLYDLCAETQSHDSDTETVIYVSTKLNNSEHQSRDDSCTLKYRFTQSSVEIEAEASIPTSFVLPILSPSGEVVSRSSQNRLDIKKPKGTVSIEANTELTIRKTKRDRVFNMIPGAQAIPIEAALTAESPLKITITVS